MTTNTKQTQEALSVEDTLKLAREAGFEQLGSDIEDWVCFTEEIERFAALVAAAAKAEEREACAKVADIISEDQWALYKGRPPYTGKELERASDYTQGKSDGAEVCAAAIRARGQQ